MCACRPDGRCQQLESSRGNLHIQEPQFQVIHSRKPICEVVSGFPPTLDGIHHVVIGFSPCFLFLFSWLYPRSHHIYIRMCDRWIVRSFSSSFFSSYSLPFSFFWLSFLLCLWSIEHRINDTLHDVTLSEAISGKNQTFMFSGSRRGKGVMWAPEVGLQPNRPQIQDPRARKPHRAVFCRKID